MTERIEDALAKELCAITGAPWEREFRPCPTRRWKIDLALPAEKLAVEIDGRMHGRAAQHIADCEKQNYLMAMGWRVFRYPASRVNSKNRRALIIEQLHRVLCGVFDSDSDANVLTGEAA